MEKYYFNLIMIVLLISLQITGCKAEEKLYHNAENIAYSNAEANQSNDNISNSRQNAITIAVAKCSPAIVGINVTEVRQVAYRESVFDDPFFRRFFGDGTESRKKVREYEVQGLGSGFLISSDGYILTNHHVAGNASKVVVTLTSGDKYDAEIIGSDMVADVALLKIYGKNFPYVNMGNSDNVIIGEWAIAFGNPFGLFDMNAKPTVTVGVVSNKDVDFLHQDQPFNRVYKGMIQTDAAISSGNSGGPLINSLGEVIGMNTVIYSTAQGRQGAGSIGIGFSVPINRVKRIVDRIKKDKQINRNFYTGMEVKEMDAQLAKYIGTDKMDGVVVYGFQRDSPAEQAGLKLGDIILEIDNYKINRIDDYYVVVSDGEVGQSIRFKLLRDGKEIFKDLELKQTPRR